MRVVVLSSLWAVVFSGCVGPRTWLVERNETGGVIGYKKGNMHLWGEEAEQKQLLAKAIDDEAKSICASSRYRIVGERRRERQYTYYSEEPVKTESKSDVRLESGTTTTTGTVTTESTTYVPVQQTGVEVWWEATVRCVNSGSQRNGSALPPERRELVKQTPGPPSTPRALTEPNTPCSEADIEEMERAGLSESDISTTCSASVYGTPPPTAPRRPLRPR